MIVRRGLFLSVTSKLATLKKFSNTPIPYLQSWVLQDLLREPCLPGAT